MSEINVDEWGMEEKGDISVEEFNKAMEGICNVVPCCICNESTGISADGKPRDAFLICYKCKDKYSQEVTA